MPTPSARHASSSTRLLTSLRAGGAGAAWRWLWLAGLVGMVAGSGAIAFFYASAALVEVLLVGMAGYAAGGPEHEPAVLLPLAAAGPAAGIALLPLLLLPAAGNALANWLKTRFAPDRVPFGNDTVVDAYHRRPAPLRWHVPLVNLLASALTLGSGGSGGREGPVAQIGAGLGQWIGERLRLTATERRVLLAAGMAAGIGAIFRAPLAAALLASEILYRGSDVEAEVLTPAIIASVAAYSLFSVVTGDFNPLFSLGALPLIFGNPLELLAYAVLAGVVAVTGIFNVWLYRALGRTSQRLTALPTFLRAGLGGLLTGATAVGLYGLASLWFADSAWLDAVRLAVLNVLSFGYGLIQGLINPVYAEQQGFLSLAAPPLILAPVLLLVAFGKMLTTGFTIGFGGAAGTFGPSIVIGGCLGGALGAGFALLQGALPTGAPTVAPPLAACVIVGMAAYFAAIAKAPLASVVMVAELTASYGLLIPAVWTCTLALLLVGPRRGVLFPSQPMSRADSLAHRGDFVVDVFKGMTLRDIVTSRLEPGVPIPEEWPLARLLPSVIQTPETYFPVVDKQQRLVGILSLNDIREVLYDETRQALHELVTARDIATTQVNALRLDEPLNDALARFTAHHWEYLPVIEPGAADELPRLVGMLSRRALLAEYTDRLHALKHEEPAGTRIVRHPLSGRRSVVPPADETGR